ncbi:hypothetical protein GCM10027075_10620 [Streptomyces heilongjiangensis]
MFGAPCTNQDTWARQSPLKAGFGRDGAGRGGRVRVVNVTDRKGFPPTGIRFLPACFSRPEFRPAEARE